MRLNFTSDVVTCIRATLFVVLLLASGCARTIIPSRPASVHAVRLASLQNRTINVQINCPDKQELGSQFLFLVIPFGSTELSELQTMVANILQERLALKGYATNFNRTAGNRMIVECSDISLTVYDLLFFRQVVAHAQVAVTLQNRGVGQTALSGVGDSNEAKLLPRFRTLQATTEKVIQLALDDVLEKTLPFYE